MNRTTRLGTAALLVAFPFGCADAPAPYAINSDPSQTGAYAQDSFGASDSGQSGRVVLVDQGL